MSKPKLKLQISKTEWILESIGLLGVLLMIGFVIASYNNMPDLIPRHYNASGIPNSYGSKSMLFIFPAMASVLYLLLSISVRFRHRFNYPFEITEHNADRQYKNLTTMVRAIKVLTIIILFYLTYATVQNGLGKMHGVGPWTAPVIILSVLMTIGFFIRRGFKLK